MSLLKGLMAITSFDQQIKRKNRERKKKMKKFGRWTSHTHHNSLAPGFLGRMSNFIKNANACVAAKRVDEFRQGVYGTKIDNCYENCITTRLTCSRLIENDFLMQNEERVQRKSLTSQLRLLASSNLQRSKLENLRYRLLQDHLEIRNFSSSVENISLVLCAFSFYT